MTNRNVLILLNSKLSVGENHKPFSSLEIMKIIDKLNQKNHTLKDIYGLDKDQMYTLFFDTTPRNELNILFIERLFNLISREGSMAFDLMEIKKWGIDILTIFDENYPKVFMNYLGNKAPVLLYYSGNLNLLSQNFIGFSGSRLNNLDIEDEIITRSWSNVVIKNGFGIVSGGASGVDSFAVQEAIKSKMSFIEFLSDSMIKRLKISQISKSLQEGNGLLLSESIPMAPFNAGMAMSRNKYIYLLAKKVIVIRAEYTIKNKIKTGGTWNGAIENLNSSYPKLFVIENTKAKGNIELIELGGIPIEISADESSVRKIIHDETSIIDFEQHGLSEEYLNQMIKELKNPQTIQEVNLTKRQLEDLDEIKLAISKVDVSFKELQLNKKLVDKLYKFCFEKVKMNNEKPSLFDL
jgi:predicted Rossmann fold nucleotide-binding protein DprA/Smf involved in DNA uptake